ncbi:hypothetical protein JXA88_18530 [Candidatus Fermentibacteria bacterium]|nr:hypothetical protein [Candidatus Fermentibacteria bacterium]
MMSRWRIHGVAPGAVAAAVACRVPSLAGKPVVLVKGCDDQTVEYASPSALSAGVVRGMRVAQAMARCPEGQAISSPRATREALRVMLVDAFEDDTTFVGHDEVGLAVWESAPAAQVNRIEAWFETTLGVEAHAAAARGGLAARVAAFSGETVPPVIMPGCESADLGPAPLTGLPWLPWRGVETLAHGWAVFTVGDLAELPGALSLKLLGREGLDLHALARGHRVETQADAQARVALSPPSNDAAGSRRAVLAAADRAWHTLSCRGLGVRRVEIRVWQAGRAPSRRTAIFDPEAEDPMTVGAEACRLVSDLWSRAAVSSVDVRLWGGAPAGMQLPLFPQRKAFRVARLGATLALLGQRYGQACVRRGSTIGLVP